MEEHREQGISVRLQCGKMGFILQQNISAATGVDWAAALPVGTKIKVRHCM